MKLLRCLILFFLTCPSSLFSQTDSISDNFLYLFSGELIESNNINYRDPLIGRPSFLVDRMEIPAEKVKYVKFYQGYFAKTSYVGFNSGPSWAKCFSSGEINFFENAIGFIGPGVGGTSKKFFFSTGFDDLKKAKYKNLKIALSGNEESMAYLNKYKALTTVEIIGYIGGSALLIAGIAKQIKV